WVFWVMHAFVHTHAMHVKKKHKIILEPNLPAKRRTKMPTRADVPARPQLAFVVSPEAWLSIAQDAWRDRRSMADFCRLRFESLSVDSEIKTWLYDLYKHMPAGSRRGTFRGLADTYRFAPRMPEDGDERAYEPEDKVDPG